VVSGPFSRGRSTASGASPTGQSPGTAGTSHDRLGCGKMRHESATWGSSAAIGVGKAAGAEDAARWRGPGRRRQIPTFHSECQHPEIIIILMLALHFERY